MLTSLLALLLAVAHADTPVDALPAALRDAYEAGESAWARGELEEAENAFVRVTDEAPGFDRAWRRRCGVVLAQQRVDEAVGLCRKAVELSESHENRTALAITLLQQDALDPEATGLLTAVTEAEPDYLPAWVATCQWATEAAKPKVLATCVDKLELLSPNTPGTLLYKALLLLSRNDLQGAELALFQAGEKGLTDELRVQAEARLAQRRQQLSILQRQRAAQQRKGRTPSWTAADVLPLVVGAALVLAVGVLAFGRGEDEELEGGDGPDAPAS